MNEQYAIDSVSNYIDEYLQDKSNKEDSLKWKSINDENGNIVSIKRGEQTLQIGDYIYYNPLDGAVEMSYVSDSSKNGYGQQKFDLGNEESSYNCKELSWKVLGVDENGNLLIVSEDIIRPTSGGYQKNFSMYGKTAFINGKEELNNICKLFGQGYGAIGGRSIIIDDISKIIGFKPTTGKVNYFWGSSGAIYYQTDYDNSYSNQGMLGNKHNSFTYYDFLDETWKEIFPSQTATSENRELFVSLDATSCDYRGHGLDTNSKIAKMIFNGKNGEQLKYWLADRCIVATNVAAAFSFLTVEYLDRMPNMISTNGVYESNDKSIHWTFPVRAVVTIDKNVKLSGGSEEGWNLEK